MAFNEVDLSPETPINNRASLGLAVGNGGVSQVVYVPKRGIVPTYRTGMGFTHYNYAVGYADPSSVFSNDNNAKPVKEKITSCSWCGSNLKIENSNCVNCGGSNG